MLSALFLLLTSTFATTPLGEGKLHWGMSEKALIERHDVKKVNTENPQGQHFTEFMEIDPVVYIDRSVAGKKIEFYFFKGKLYKTLIIHLDQSEAQEFYKAKIRVLNESFGKFTQQRQSLVYNIPVFHTIWDFDNEEYDLRYGAGYVYEVRTHKPTAEIKQKVQDGWELI